MISLSWQGWIWLFVMAALIHNLEEAIWLPRWRGFALARRWGVTARAFRFATAAISALTIGAGLAATIQGPRGVGAYLICGIAFAMVLNVVFPHLLACAWTKSYAPGAGTSLLLVAPAGVSLIATSLAGRLVEPPVFLWAGPAVATGLAASSAFLLTVGRLLQGSTA
jgi:hypothetical protein